MEIQEQSVSLISKTFTSIEGEWLLSKDTESGDISILEWIGSFNDEGIRASVIFNNEWQLPYAAKIEDSQSLLFSTNDKDLASILYELQEQVIKAYLLKHSPTLELFKD